MAENVPPTAALESDELREISANVWAFGGLGAISPPEYRRRTKRLGVVPHWVRQLLSAIKRFHDERLDHSDDTWGDTAWIMLTTVYLMAASVSASPFEDLSQSQESRLKERRQVVDSKDGEMLERSIRHAWKAKRASDIQTHRSALTYTRLAT